VSDPVLARRRRIAGLVVLGKRVGYGLFALATVLFVVAMVSGFTNALTSGIVASLLIGSLVLAPAIVLGYAVKAADREDRLARGSSDPPG
jgi:hypothetical protein